MVVEAAPRSGSLITARLAGEAGREVMAVPGSPLDPRAQGCNLLIRDGATLVQSVDDILEAIRPIDARAVRSPASGFGGEPPADAGDAERRAVDRRCSARCRSPVDELIRQSGLRAGGGADGAARTRTGRAARAACRRAGEPGLSRSGT